MNFRRWLEVTGRQNVVLIATGAYHPVHRGHIKMFYFAKSYLLRHGYDVVAAYIVPRNFGYIQKKSAAKGESPIENRHRLAMLSAATQGTFVKLLPLDDEQQSSTSTLNLQQRNAIRGRVQQMHPDAMVVWVAGDDKGGCPESENTCLLDLPDWGKTVIIGRVLAGDASSTKVRQDLASTGDEPTLLSPAVRSYVHKNHLWNAS